MDCSFPFLIRRYSTFRSDLPFVVWQRYFTKASSGPVATRSRSKCPTKLICVSQHCFLKALLLMWSSPAALEKVKSSASRLSSGPQSFCPQPAYHFRTTSSVDALALASPGRLTAPTSAQAPVASRFLRDSWVLVIIRSSFSWMWVETLCPIATMTVRTYVPVGMYRCQEPMQSDPLAVARRAQRPQPAHDIVDPRLYHFWILSILCQRAIAFDHGNQ